MFFRIINNIISFVINAYHSTPHWKRQEINRVWRDYRRGRIQCWHINAEDKRVHKTTINQNDILLTLTENEISILTEQMWDINKNDVIFLYENEDEGYHSCAYLARIARTSDQLSPSENEQEIERAIDDIVKHNPLGIYKKIKVEGEPDLSVSA